MPSSPWLLHKFKDFACTLARPVYGGIGCILALHRIVPEDLRSPIRENRSLEISPGALRALLDWVRRRGLDVIRLDEVKNRLASPRGDKFICFTFDDGYRDNLKEAFPIFRDHGYPFAVNIATGFVNRTASLWWYTLEDVMARISKLNLTWGGRVYDWRWQSPEEREHAFGEIAGLIRQQSLSSRDSLVAEICQVAKIDPFQRTQELIMDWDDLAKLTSQWYATIGAHTSGHHNLSQLTEEELEGELIDAKAELEARLNRPVQHLAYPFGGRGSVGRREFNAARECDYVTAVTTRTGNLFHQHAWHLQALPRLTISGNYPPLTLIDRLESGLLPAQRNKWKRVLID